MCDAAVVALDLRARPDAPPDAESDLRIELRIRSRKQGYQRKNEWSLNDEAPLRRRDSRERHRHPDARRGSGN